MLAGKPGVLCDKISIQSLFLETEIWSKQKVQAKTLTHLAVTNSLVPFLVTLLMLFINSVQFVGKQNENCQSITIELSTLVISSASSCYNLYQQLDIMSTSKRCLTQCAK